MNIIDITDRFKDNAHKVSKKVIWHWTGGNTASGAIKWLDDREDVDGDGIGDGTIAYNYIIDKNGDVYMLGNPKNTWFHNTGLGSEYDKDTISISLVCRGKKDSFTEAQIESSKRLYSVLKCLYQIEINTHHASINLHKQDFPDKTWVDFKKKII